MNPSREIIFVGCRAPEPIGATVFMHVDGEFQALPPRLDLRRFSPDGFEWGYAGSAPAQLALAMCAQLVDDETACVVFPFVNGLLVAGIPRDRLTWCLTAAQVREVIASVRLQGI